MRRAGLREGRDGLLVVLVGLLGGRGGLRVRLAELPEGRDGLLVVLVGLLEGRGGLRGRLAGLRDGLKAKVIGTGAGLHTKPMATADVLRDGPKDGDKEVSLPNRIRGMGGRATWEG